jgi:hypothetical protein
MLVILPDRARVARMPGSSIAAPGAAGWITDFLNAAYFARPAARREVDDLRLAFCVLTTRWHAKGARLGARDVVAFHRAFGVDRLRSAPRLTLGRDALLAGGARLLGDWFPAAYGDPERRAHGIAFPTAGERAAFDPGARLRHAALGRLTPPRLAPERQAWSDYAPVPVEDPGRTAALLRAPERWPDVASELGRFTALRPGGLEGQTFEIEVLGVNVPRAPLYTRGYVTATRVDGAWARAFVPEGARLALAIELTTHAGHFLGRAISRILVWEDGEGAWLRDVGSWDPLPPELAAAGALGGRAAQHAFWGPERPEQSMLAQVALASRAA